MTTNEGGGKPNAPPVQEPTLTERAPGVEPNLAE